MKYHILAFGAGFLLDQLFGDPYFLPHPIRGIGWLIAKTEKILRAGNPQGNSTEREGAERRQGKLLVVIVLLFTGMLSALILFGAYAMHPGLGVVIEAVMTYQILAARCLQVESSKVWKQLNAGSLEEARKAAIRRQMRECQEDVAAWRPDVLVAVDYPGFNMKMARWAKEHGIRVFYYIAPKVWAWREWRVKAIREYVAYACNICAEIMVRPSS